MSVSRAARGNIGSLNIDVPEPRGLANGVLTKPKQSHVLNSYHLQPLTVGAAANRWQTSFKIRHHRLSLNFEVRSFSH